MASRKWWISRTVAERTFWYGSNGSAETAICRPSWGEYQQTLMRKRCICIVHVKSQSASTEQRTLSLLRAGLIPWGQLCPRDGRRQAASSPRPVSGLAIVKELSLSGAVGKRGAGSAPRKVNVWRLPSPPLWLRRSSLEKPNRWLFADLRSTALHPRRWSCPIVGAPAVASAGAGEPRSGPGPRMKISSRVSATRPARHRRPP